MEIRKNRSYTVLHGFTAHKLAQSTQSWRDKREVEGRVTNTSPPQTQFVLLWSTCTWPNLPVLRCPVYKFFILSDTSNNTFPKFPIEGGGGAVTEILVREIIPRPTCNPTLPLCSSPDTHWLTCRPQTYPNSYGLGMRSDQFFQHQNPLAGQHLDKTSIYPYTVNVLTFVSTHFHELYALRKNFGDFYFRSCRRSTQNFSI